MSSNDQPPINSQYHPASVRALTAIRAKLQALLTDVEAAIVANPPPAPAQAAVSTALVQGTVKADTLNVYATADENAAVVGEIAQGAVLPLVLDPSRSGGSAWYGVTAGQYNGKFVQGVYLNMQ